MVYFAAAAWTLARHRVPARPSQGALPQSYQGVTLEALVFPVLRVLAALLLVALNGLFVAAEFSFVKIRATQVDRLVEEGRASAGLVKEATGRLDAYLAVCQLGITISSLGLGALGEPAMAALIEPVLEPLGMKAAPCTLSPS